MADTSPSTLTLQANGFTFDALSIGPADGELVLLLHGFPQFADSWSAVAARIAATAPRYRLVAVTQRGYSEKARPTRVEDYATAHLVADVIGFADALTATTFRLIAHDWGALVAWNVAAKAPTRVKSMTLISTPHPDALSAALRSDFDQMRKSSYIALFRAPLHVAEASLLAFDAKLLRNVYAGKVPPAQVDANVRRFQQGGTLTAALNWYRAIGLSDQKKLGPISVPTVFIWGDEDQALGETAALATANHVTGPYRFERLKGRSHWILDETPDEVARIFIEQTKHSKL